MFNSSEGYSLSDIAAVTDGNRNNSGWGNDGGAWWIIILFLFVFCGWGGNGFGGFGNNGASGALTRADLCQDMNFSDLEAGIRGVSQGLCDGFYAMNTGMLNGFAGLQNNLTSEFRGLDNAVCTLGYQTQAGFNSVNVANMQNTNAITAQLNSMAAQNASCCCETQREIEKGFCDVNYNLATQSCDTRRTITDSARDIIDNANANTRSIIDFLVQDKISTLESENQGLKLAASQQAQNTYLVNQLRPCPIPAYQVANPYCCNTGYTGCGYYNNSCGC